MDEVDREKVRRGFDDINNLDQPQLEEILALAKEIPQLEKTFEEKMAESLAESRLASIILLREEEEKNNNNLEEIDKSTGNTENTSTNEVLEERIRQLEALVEQLLKKDGIIE